MTLFSPLTLRDVTLPNRVGISPMCMYASREGFVTDLKKHIKLGDIIQAVPSQRLAKPTSLHPFNIYRHLRSINPSPYMFYLDLKDFTLVGASPEMLVKGGAAWPISGARTGGRCS